MRPKPTIAAILAFVTLSAALTFFGVRSPAQKVEPGRIYNRFTGNEGNRPLQGHPIMVSAIRDGQVVEQQETQFNGDRTLDGLQPGLYDVRAEGDGAVTEEKRGVHVFAGRSVDLYFDLRLGKGVHIVEYATGGLSREEVAARLGKLETAVTQLQKSIPPK